MPWSTSKRRRDTYANQREREQVLQAWPTCYVRGPGCTLTSTEDDHVIPLHLGGSDDLSNRRGICHPCHVAKTVAEAVAARRARRARPGEPHPGLRADHRQ